MIQFRRGNSKSWENSKTPLASGQPGYDKEKHKIKIGDGKKLWKDLPSASGLFTDEILSKESEADKDTLFTYGKASPKSSTKGTVYLQQFEGAVEADYVVETGRSSNYFFRKWNSGFMECWGNGAIPASINNKFTNIIFNIKTNDYFEVKGFWN